MPDLEEQSADLYEEICSDGIARARTKASKIEAGNPGTCELCEEQSLRLVRRPYRKGYYEVCAKCRDELKLG